MNRMSEKALRSEIAQEEKDEEIRLRHAIKDISLATKEQQKARKALRKADNTVAKLGKKETVATAAVQKATHKHDLAATNLRSAQRDAELKRQEDTRLQRELDDKKARLDTALQEQKTHKQERQARLLELERGGIANSAAASGVAPHGTHPTGAQHEGPNTGIGTNAGTTTQHTTSETVGNAPAQYSTGPETFGNRAGGPGHAGQYPTEGTAAGAGHGVQRDVARQGYGDELTRDGDRVGQIRATGDQATHEPSGVAHHSDAGIGTGGAYAGERSIGRHDGYPTSSSFQQTNPAGTNVGQPAVRGESGPFGARDASAQMNQIGQPEDDTVRMHGGPHTGYTREGPGDFGGPGNITGTEAKQYVGKQAIPASATGNPSATMGGGYSGGGENLGFSRGDPLLGTSGTGADAGIRSGGARDPGGRGGSREFIGDRNVGLSSAGESRYGAERIGDQQHIHHGTGIGGRQGVGEEPDFSRDRMTMGSAGRFGPGIRESGDIDNRARGSMIGNQGFGEDSMPGGYTQGARSGGLDIPKERF